MNDNDLFELLKLNLKRDEGFRSKPYRDTVGKLTIGYGRNLDDVGISEDEANVLLTRDAAVAVSEIRRAYPWIEQKPWQVRLAVYNMAFNMGLARLTGFVQMFDALDKDDFERAAKEALDSKWANQVGGKG